MAHPPAERTARERHARTSASEPTARADVAHPPAAPAAHARRADIAHPPANPPPARTWHTRQRHPPPTRGAGRGHTRQRTHRPRGRGTPASGTRRPREARAGGTPASGAPPLAPRPRGSGSARCVRRPETIEPSCRERGRISRHVGPRSLHEAALLRRHPRNRLLRLEVRKPHEVGAARVRVGPPDRSRTSAHPAPGPHSPAGPSPPQVKTRPARGPPSPGHAPAPARTPLPARRPGAPSLLARGRVGGARDLVVGGCGLAAVADYLSAGLCAVAPPVKRPRKVGGAPNGPEPGPHARAGLRMDGEAAG